MCNIHITVHLDALGVTIQSRGDIIESANKVTHSIGVPVLGEAFYDVLFHMFQYPHLNNVLFMLDYHSQKSILVSRFVADALAIPGIKIIVSCVGAASSESLSNMTSQRISKTLTQKQDKTTHTISICHSDVMVSTVEFTPNADWDAAEQSNPKLKWHRVTSKAKPCYAWIQ